MDEKSQAATNLFNLANALAVARQAEFMSREHAKDVWRKFLSESGLDVVKKPAKTEEVTTPAAK